MSVLEVNNVSIRYLTGDFKNIGLKEYVIRKITKNYQVKEFWADRHITFSLEQGEMLGIIGRNGAGKSTLLKVISGIMEPTEGWVKRKGNVAALLELASGFDGDLTVRENAYLRGAMLGYTRKFMDETYDQIIEFAELDDFQDRPFKQLSSGMKSRLAFAIASMVQPDILILDEVLSVGDGAFRKKSELKMKDIIGSGATTVLVSHSLEQIRRLCSKVLWLEKGQQIAFGDTTILCSLYQQFLNKRLTLEQAKKAWESLNAPRYDYLIVGSGLFGATFARRAVDCGKRCLVIDRRPYLGGNVYCEEKEGITIHKYGAHIFHTDNKAVWDYVKQFVNFLPYVHRVSAEGTDGKLYSLPLNMNTFQKLWGVTDEKQAREKIMESGGVGGEAANLEDQAIALVGRELYELLIKEYIEKQWGKDCRDLPASIIHCIPLCFAFDDRYFSDMYQGIPQEGYNHLIQGLLKEIPAVTGVSYQNLVEAFPEVAEKILYTGPIDEFFEYRLGWLEYRSLRFEEEVIEKPDYQGQAVVNSCSKEVPWTRTIEHRHFTGTKGKKTVITREYPEKWTPGGPAYYPVNDARNTELYQQYQKLAAEHPNIIFGGRLGSYHYYDMDDAIAAALELANKELDQA